MELTEIANEGDEMFLMTQDKKKLIDTTGQLIIRTTDDNRIICEVLSKDDGDGHKIHQIRLAAMYFDDVCKGLKPFELRKNDRHYKVGDTLELMEFKDGKNTGRMVRELVTFMLEDYTGIEEGFCIMGTVLLNENGEPMQQADIKQMISDIRANGDGCVEDSGEEYILIEKAVGIIGGKDA